MDATNVIRKMSSAEFEKYIANLNRDQLLELKNYILAANRKIKVDFAHHYDNGKFYNNDWTQSAVYVKNIFKTRIDQIKLALTKLNNERKKVKQEAQRIFECNFVDIAKETLDETTFYEIVERAKTRTDS